MKRIAWLMWVVLVGCCATAPVGEPKQLSVMAIGNGVQDPEEGLINDEIFDTLRFAPLVHPWEGRGDTLDGLEWITSIRDSVWSIQDTLIVDVEPRACHLVIFYVDTVGYKETEELVPISCPEGRPGCCVMHWAVIKRWEPVLDTIVVFSFPLEPRECSRRFSPMWKIMVE